MLITTVFSGLFGRIRYVNSQAYYKCRYFEAYVIVAYRRGGGLEDRTTHWHMTTPIFTALHGMQTRSCDEISDRPSVCPSICLSVKRVHCDKTEESYV